MEYALPCRRELLRALALRIAPPSGELDGQGWSDFCAIIARTTAPQPALLRFQLALFLFVLRSLPLLRYGSLFESLSPAEQDAFLLWLQDHPSRLVRSGFWGVRTLVMMGYYGQQRTWAKLSYAPTREGNRMLHG